MMDPEMAISIADLARLGVVTDHLHTGTAEGWLIHDHVGRPA